jgi:hypothetical protein
MCSKSGSISASTRRRRQCLIVRGEGWVVQRESDEVERTNPTSQFENQALNGLTVALAIRGGIRPSGSRWTLSARGRELREEDEPGGRLQTKILPIPLVTT